MSNFKTRVTIYEVAKVSGYSLATVSRVINKKDNVTQETKDVVEAAIKKLGYKPSALAQGLATSRTTNIGIVLPAKNYVYLSNVLSGLADIGKIYGYQTTLFLVKNEKDEVEDAIEKLIMSHVDGAIIFDDELGEEDIQPLSNYKIPVVVIGHSVSGEELASIQLDYESSLRKALHEHYRYGNEPVYFLRLENQGVLMNHLEKIAQEEMMLMGKENDFHVLTEHDSYNAMYQNFYTFFKDHHQGFFIAPRDSISCAIVNAALDHNLKVPNDVQILSVIGTKYSTIMRPKLSSLTLDMYEVGSIAMRMLTKLLTGTLKQKIFVFKSTISHRESTRGETQE